MQLTSSRRAVEAVFDIDPRTLGAPDFLLHSIGFAPAHDLQGPRLTLRASFTRAMDVSCHSFMRMARLAEPLMDKAARCSP
jgi:enoyl-[acyl-carrier protein] reductase I